MSNTSGIRCSKVIRHPRRDDYLDDNVFVNMRRPREIDGTIWRHLICIRNGQSILVGQMRSDR